MTPFYLNQHSSEPLIGGGDHDHVPLHDPFALAPEAPPFPFPLLFNAPQDQEDHHSQQQPEMIGETSYPSVSPATNYYSSNDHATINQSMYDPHVRDGNQQGSGEWMSSKMRIMRKMLSTDQRVARGDQEEQQKPNHQERISSSKNISISPNGIIRVCSDCNTTKTPLWRSGPRGPKSLCNACGIRQRKARRAAAAAALGGGLVPAETRMKVPKDQKRSIDVDRTVPFKKRCRFSSAGKADHHHDQKQLRFEDMTINLGKSSAMHRVFPQDERDAAILLMALSCGLISR